MEEANVVNVIDDRTAAKQARTWAQIARLATESLAALDGGKVKDARSILIAIRGVALNADRGG